MNTQEFGNNGQSHFISSEGSQALIREHAHPIRMLLLIVLGSFVLGSIPIIYGSTLAQTQTQAPAIPGEAGLWSSLGERQ